MKDDREPRIGTETLAAYLEGELTQTESARVDAELRENGSAQAKLEQVARIRNILQRQDREIEGIDLVLGVRQALLQPEVSAPQRSARWFAAGGVAVAASVALFVALRPPAPKVSEFQARSVSTSPVDPARWVGFKIYRQRPQVAPELVHDRLGRNEGLLFSYTNLGAQPFDYLMLFAVSTSGRVYWFYPAYEQAGSNPQSIRIDPGAADTLLSEVVRHDYAAGNLRVCALFSRRPLGVLEVETWLERHRDEAPARSPFPDTNLQCVRLEIE